jgi:hypothetical protein
LTPSQFSATSHGPAEARHVVDDDFTASAGQFTPLPVQNSVSSQTSPAEPARHTVLPGAKASAGQLSETPSQNSATSHGPATARHPSPAARLTSGPQVAEAPEQTSAKSQTPAAARQVVDDPWNAFAGQVVLAPVQFSWMSQNPAEARHTVAADAGVAWLQAPPTHWSIEQGLLSLVQAVPFATAAHPQVPSENVVPPLQVAV